uniref:Uncharacterized protein n=2 Tax=viral metagenome TaxID=1070528 RepID=A0A6M3K2U5_9ZZZZ
MSIPVKTEFTQFAGGLNTQSPKIALNPGACLSAMNYVASLDGGYERIDGYERYDGRTAPSSASYYYVTCSFLNGGPSVSDTITGNDSGATGVVIVVGDGYICYTKLTSAFTADETYNVGGTDKGTFTGDHSENGETTSQLHGVALNLAADKYRADIAAPTGSGAIRGLALLNGTLYAFRDNAGGTAGLIYKATASGWSAITLYNELYFDTGVGLISDNDTVTQLVSGATATVKRVVLQSGEWGADAAGKLVLSGITGTFDNTNALQVGAVTQATSTSTADQIVILPGGRYEFDIHNFTGSTATKRIYGCDGVNRGFEFDGTIYVPIDTGMTADTPLHVKCYKGQLFFSFLGSSQNSGIGRPYEWTPITGASEIALGDDITGYLVEAETLLIFARNSTYSLSGDSVDTFFLDPLDNESGAIAYTLQHLYRNLCLDDQGVVDVTRAQEYGNFSLGICSRKIQDRIDVIRSKVTASSIYKHKSQYRIYANDGTGLTLTIGSGEYGPEYYFMPFEYPVYPSCAVTGEDSTGKDVVFFGSSAGMVYQADKGTSFDGEDIEFYIFTAFNNSKSPALRKRYRRAVIEMTNTGYTTLRFNALFSYGDSDIPTHLNDSIEVSGTGGLWDISLWDRFYYDAAFASLPSFSLSGTGTNVSVAIYGKTDEDLGHKLDGIIIHYTPRRLQR